MADSPFEIETSKEDAENGIKVKVNSSYVFKIVETVIVDPPVSMPVEEIPDELSEGGIWFQHDETCEYYQNYKIVLEQVDGTVLEEVLFTDKEAFQDGYYYLKFSDIQSEQKYNIAFSPGENGVSYYIASDVSGKFLLGED